MKLIAILAAGLLMQVGCVSNREAVREAPAPAGLGTLALVEFENLTDQPNASQAVMGILRVELESRGIPLIPETAAGADHLIMGRITEYHYRHGLTEQSVVGFTIRAVSAKTGKTVWSATCADRGAASFTGGESLTEVTRRICQKAADRLSASK